jgi:beta-phosphoglucomutase-like phosphatase (HAD superfamily)
VKQLHLAGKPAPDSFIEAATLLGVSADHAVVIEDALAGVEAGRAGHFALVVGVDNHDEPGAHAYADQLHEHGAIVVVRDLREVLGESPT